MKVLFIHNTAPNYRIPFFLKVANKIEIKYIFTSIDVNKKIYGSDIDIDSLSKIDYKILKNGITAYLELYKQLKEQDFEIVVIPPLDSIREFLLGGLAFIFCKIKNKKTIYFWEKWEAPVETQPIKRKIKNRVLRVFSSIIFKRVDICLSPGIKNKEYFINAGVKEEKIRKIHDSCEMPINSVCNIRQKYKISNDTRIILYYGRIIQQKGLDILIKAYSQLSEEEKNKMSIVVAGDGPFSNYCKTLAKKLKIENIYFAGYVHPNERYDYFSQCDIFVHPGWFFEGKTDVWGLTLNEALQLGKVIISTTAVGAAYELIKGNGMIIEQNDVLALRNALNKVNSQDFIEKTKLVSKQIYDKYNYESMSNDFKKVVDELT